MALYDCKCPKCGHVNVDVNLVETEGYMECEVCKKITQFQGFRKGHWIPVYSSLADLPEELLQGGRNLHS